MLLFDVEESERKKKSQVEGDKDREFDKIFLCFSLKVNNKFP